MGMTIDSDQTVIAVFLFRYPWEHGTGLYIGVIARQIGTAFGADLFNCTS